MDLGSGVRDINELIWFVHSKYGLDLTRYRTSCIARRVSHRMSMLGIGELERYIAYLGGHAEEMDSLLDTVTIHVTGFFRDSDVFECLLEQVYPPMIARKISGGERIVRLWSAGCATGEETYSLAIQLADIVRIRRLDLKIEVFGTDISEDALRVARRGEYPGRKLSEVPPSQKSRYFERAGECHRISPAIRSLVKFQAHDVFHRPPFSLLDLVVCRNVLIHFDHDARNDVMTHFHDSLAEGGYLLLGKSEAVTGAALRLFELVSPRSKVYRKISDPDLQGGMKWGT